MVFQAIQPRWLRTPKVVSRIQAIHKADTSKKLSLLANFVGRQAERLHMKDAKVAENDTTVETQPDVQSAYFTGCTIEELRDPKDDRSGGDTSSSSGSETFADDSDSATETLCNSVISFSKSQSGYSSAATSSDSQFSESQWDAIMQLSFSHFREREALKALVLSTELCHKNKLHDLRAKEEHRLASVRDEAWTAGERAGNRNSISTNLSHKLELRKLQRQHKKELRSVRRDAADTVEDLMQQLASANEQLNPANEQLASTNEQLALANEENRKMQAALRLFKARDEYLKDVLQERFDQANQFEEELAEARLGIEQRAKRIRELERSQDELQQSLTNVQAKQAESEEQVQQLSMANNAYAGFMRLLEQTPGEDQSSTFDPHGWIGDCQGCASKENQNRILREVSYSLAEKIVETRHVAAAAQHKLESLKEQVKDTPDADTIQPQELIALQKQQLSDLRKESSDFAACAKKEVHGLEIEMLKMKVTISRLETNNEAQDADLTLAKHSAAEADSLRRRLAVALDMATKKQNERQIRKSAAVLNREQQSFIDELATLKAHDEAYKTLLSKTLDTSVEAQVRVAEEERATMELREAHSKLQTERNELHVKYEEASWKCEHHDQATELLTNQYHAELDRRQQVMDDMQAQLDEIMSCRPSTANDAVLALLDMERANSHALQEHAKVQEAEIERLRSKEQHYGFYARAYEMIAAHVDWWQHKTESRMDEVTRFDVALFEEIGERFGEAMKVELREKTIRRYQKIKREKEQEREEMFRVKDGMVEEAMGEEDGNAQEREGEQPYGMPPVG